MTIQILMPIHNAEKTIERSLQSIISQTYEFWQLYCVLNCCTDNTEEVISNFFNKQPWNIKRPIMLECNIKGIVPALNTGLVNILYHKELGDWISRADADDWWFPTKLKEQVEYLKEHPDVKILGTQIRLVDEEGNPKPAQEPIRPLDNDNIKRSLLAGKNCIAHPSVMVHKDVFIQCGMYDNQFPMAEDLALWLRVIKWFTFANLSETLVDYTAVHNLNYNPKSPEIAAYTTNIILSNLG